MKFNLFLFFVPELRRNPAERKTKKSRRKMEMECFNMEVAQKKLSELENIILHILDLEDVSEKENAFDLLIDMISRMVLMTVAASLDAMDSILGFSVPISGELLEAGIKAMLLTIKLNIEKILAH
jgi:hypothetical protein